MKTTLLIVMLGLTSLTGCASRKPLAVPSIGVTTQEAPDAPLAVKTQTAGVVLSPYYPHGLLDVSGVPSGTVVLDPGSGFKMTVP